MTEKKRKRMGMQEKRKEMIDDKMQKRKMLMEIDK